MFRFALRAGLPGGRTFILRCRTAKHAAFSLRRLAARLGVSPIALEWSVEPLK